jgi:hypothetical protein
MHLRFVETYRCRPCVKDFEGASMANVRRCPQCGGPLLSLATLLKHEQETQGALDRLRKHSAATLAGCALLMVVMQAVLASMQSAEVAGFFNKLLLGVATASILASALWLFTKHKFWMLAGAILLQTSAALFFFVVMGTTREMALPLRWELFIASLPMAGALVAWHQFRSYCQLLKLEQTKGRGSRVGSIK